MVGEISSSQSKTYRDRRTGRHGLPPGGRAAHRGPVAADDVLRPAGPRRQVQRAAVQHGPPRHLHGQGRHLPRRVAADQPADGALRRRRRGQRGPGRAVAGDDRPALPALPGDQGRRVVGPPEGDHASPGPWSTRCRSCSPSRSAATTTCSTRARRSTWIHAPETWAQIKQGPAPLPVRGGAGHPAGARPAPARRAGHGRQAAHGWRRRAAGGVRRAAAVRAHRRPARDRRADRAGPRPALPDEPAAPGRGRLRQDPGGAARDAARRRLGRPGRAARADRGARPAAPPLDHRAARRPRRRRDARRRARRPRSSCSPAR